MWIHGIVGVTAIGLTITFSLLGLKYLDWTFKAGDLHTYFGSIILFLVLFLGITGIVAKGRLTYAKWSTRKSLIIKSIHKYFAYLMILIAQI